MYALENRMIQYIRWSNHAFVADTDICFRNTVCLVIIGRGASCGNGQHKNILAVLPFGSEDKVRIRRDALLNQAAYRLCIGLCVSQANYVSVIINAEKECAADTVGKCAYTFEPAFRLLYFQSNETPTGHVEVTYCIICGSELNRVFIAGHLPGDINGDGSVNNKDATRLFQYLSGWDVEVVEDALDVNGDGSINNKDATRLFQYLSGWDVVIC